MLLFERPHSALTSLLQLCSLLMMYICWRLYTSCGSNIRSTHADLPDRVYLVTLAVSINHLATFRIDSLPLQMWACRKNVHYTTVLPFWHCDYIQHTRVTICNTCHLTFSLLQRDLNNITEIHFYAYLKGIMFYCLFEYDINCIPIVYQMHVEMSWNLWICLFDFISNKFNN